MHSDNFVNRNGWSFRLITVDTKRRWEERNGEKVLPAAVGCENEATVKNGNGKSTLMKEKQRGCACVF